MDIPYAAPPSKSSMNLGSEMGHARFRLYLTLGFIVYLLVGHFSGHIKHMNNAAFGVAAFLVFSVVWLGMVGFSIFTFKTRRILSIIFDQVAFAFALYQAGEVLAPALWGPILMAIGNGLRNGPFFAKLSSIIGGVSVGMALWLSPHWQVSHLVAEGIVLAIIVLPWYTVVLSEQIAQAKRAMKLRAARFESASRTDSLTGILNRSGFFHALQKPLQEAKTLGVRSAVMLLDLDGFKAVNDACGHGAGDDVLREVAARLCACMRSSDKVARIGGDEFGVLMTGMADSADVERLAQMLIDSVAQTAVPCQPQLRLGASIGICLLPDDACLDEAAVMATADRLMYQSKKAGKNQYRIAA